MSISDKLTTIAENEQKVFEAGRTQEWSDFWDVFQKKGTRTNYENAFACGVSTTEANIWNANTFRPKYDIKAKYTQYMFYRFPVTNLKEILSECGVSYIDNSTSLYNFASHSSIKEMPDFSKVAKTNLQRAFQDCANLVSIDGLKIGAGCTSSYCFSNTPKLRDITFYGVIDNSINFYTCPLSPTSVKSIIDCLKNYAGTSSELTNKLTLSSACWEELEADSTSPTGGTWQDYVFSLGWNT